MDKKYIIVAVIVLVIIGTGYYFYGNRAFLGSGSPPSEPMGAPPPVPDNEGSMGKVITMNANGFSPSDLTIKKGEMVTFKNEDSRDRWPASAVHPTHQVCPGFDALKPLKSGESYSHTFIVAKECPFHDHLSPSLQGKITITD